MRARCAAGPTRGAAPIGAFRTGTAARRAPAPLSRTPLTECSSSDWASTTGGVGGGSGTQTFVDQKGPDKIFPTANFVSSHDGHFGLGGGGTTPPSSESVRPF